MIQIKGTPSAIVIASIILGISIFVSGGFYEFSPNSSEPPYSAMRLNKITGNIDLCLVDIGCLPLFVRKVKIKDD